MPSGTADPHGWNSWTAYLAAHEGRLGDYADHFLLDDRLERTLTDVVARWVGELICSDGYEIHVRRVQTVDIRQGTPWVKTFNYSYQALHRRHETARSLFRYDNIHVHERHPDAHHRHRFDTNGVEIRPVEHIGVDHWPNLGQVLDELHEYWVLKR